MIGVLTGDIVAFSRVPTSERGALLERLDRVIQEMSRFYLDGQIIAHQIFRGDSFQIAMEDPRWCLDEALALYLAMQREEFGPGPKVELRIGIGFGEAHRGETNELGRWGGEAFELAANALGPLRSERIALRTPYSAMDAEFEVHLALLDTIIRRWTSDQQEVLFGALREKGQTKMAEELGISQPAVSQRLRNAGWDGVQSLLRRYKFSLDEIDYKV